MTIHELIEKRNELDNQIRESKAKSRIAALAEIREIMETHGLTVNDFGAESKTRKPIGKVPMKYLNVETGEAWSGRGLQPKWIRSALEAGAKKEDFLIV